MADGGRAAKQSRSGDKAPSPSASPSGATSASPLHQNLQRLQGAAGNRAVQRLVSKPSSSRAPVQREMTDEQIDAALLKQKAGREQELINMESAGGVVSSSVPTPASYKKPATPEPTTRPRSNAISGGPAPAAASEPPAHPAPIALPDKFKGEDTSVAWRAFYGAEDRVKAGTMPEAELKARKDRAAQTDTVTDYHSPEKQASNTLGVEAGGSLTARGKTADFRKTEYAMSPTGDVVANLDNVSSTPGIGPDGKPQKQNLHHSSMLAGGDVAHAGHVGAAGGKVNYLDDDSGHYRPDEAHTFDAFSRLADQGSLDQNSTSGRVELVDKTVTKGLGKRGASANVHFSGYQQSGGNETGIRAKGAMLSELTSKVAPVAPAVEGQAPAGPPAPPAMVFDPNADEPNHYDNVPNSHYENVPNGGGLNSHYENRSHYEPPAANPNPNANDHHYDNVPNSHYENVPNGGGLNSHYENGSHYDQTVASPGGGGNYNPTVASMGGGSHYDQTVASMGGGNYNPTVASMGGGSRYDQTVAGPGGGSHYDQTVAGPGGGSHYDQTVAGPGGGGNYNPTVASMGGGNNYNPTVASMGGGGNYNPTVASMGGGGNYDPTVANLAAPSPAPVTPTAPAFGGAPGGLYGQYVASDMPAPAQSPYAPSLTPSTPPTPTPPAPPTPYAASLSSFGPAPTPDPNAPPPTPNSPYATYLPPERR